MRARPGDLQLFHGAVTLYARSSFTISEGIPLRYRLDGSLFNLRRLQARTRTAIDHVFELQYADDTALVSHSPGGLQRLLDGMTDAYTRAGLVVNTRKTEILQQSGRSGGVQHGFHIGGAPLANVDRFTYLGSVLSKAHDLTNEVQRRIHLASAAFGRLSHRVFLNRDLTIKTKVAVYNAVCVSTLVYGCEAWTAHRRHIHILERFHISCLQRILRLHWRDKVPHVEIRRRADCPSMEVILATRQLRWTGHVIRMPSNRLPRRALYGELAEGRRSVGGQFKRFKDHIKATLKKCGLDPAQLEDAAADRTRWRGACRAGAVHFQRELDRGAEERRARRHAAAAAAPVPVLDPALRCPTCGRQCLSRIGLHSHMRTHPTG